MARFPSWRDTTAVGATVDFHQHFQGRFVALGRGFELIDIVDIIDAHENACVYGQGGHTLDHMWVHDFVGNHQVAHSAVEQRFCFTDFLAAHADRAALDLIVGDVGGFMAFGMGPQAHAMVLCEFRHAIEIALVGVQVKQQARRVDIFEAGTDGSRQIGKHANSR